MLKAPVSYPFAKMKKPPKSVRNRGLFSFKFGSPHWKHSELFFKKKAFIPALQQLLIA